MNNLLKMQRYHILHNRVYVGGIIGMFIMGFSFADSYLSQVMGHTGKAATSLVDILNGMVYDSTFLIILLSIMIALILGQEFSCRTINQEICAGHEREQVFAAKIITYLMAFNIMVIIYPIAGCIREYTRFGLGDAGVFIYYIVRVIIYSFLLNSAMFLIPILCSFYFRSTLKTVAVTALVTFMLCLCLGYGMKFEIPIFFLPSFQIREVANSSEAVKGTSCIVAAVWSALLVLWTWHIFGKCDLK